MRQQHGLLITTTFRDRGRYLKGHLFYDLAKTAMNRLAFALALTLTRSCGPTASRRSPSRPAGCAPSSSSPVTRPTSSTGTSGARSQSTESPRYLGRAVAALAADRGVHTKTGGVYLVGDLAREYGFTDIDGRVIPPFEIE